MLLRSRSSVTLSVQSDTRTSRLHGAEFFSCWLLSQVLSINTDFDGCMKLIKQARVLLVHPTVAITSGKPCLVGPASRVLPAPQSAPTT